MFFDVKMKNILILQVIIFFFLLRIGLFIDLVIFSFNNENFFYINIFILFIYLEKIFIYIQYIQVYILMVKAMIFSKNFDKI